jgi:hypothetical protein
VVVALVAVVAVDDGGFWGDVVLEMPNADPLDVATVLAEELVGGGEVADDADEGVGISWLAASRAAFSLASLALRFDTKMDPVREKILFVVEDTVFEVVEVELFGKEPFFGGTVVLGILLSRPSHPPFSA